MLSPNQLTFLRIFFAFACPALFLWRQSLSVLLVVLFLFTIACLTDWWDGQVARARSMVTTSGKILDPIADKFLVLGLMFAFAGFGLYRVEWVVIILTREMIVTATRLVRLRKGQVLPAEWAGKIKVGFQVCSIYLTLFYLMLTASGQFDAERSTILTISSFLHEAGIILAMSLTVVSGIIFFSRLERA